jgi:hypothetical protein
MERVTHNFSRLLRNLSNMHTSADVVITVMFRLHIQVPLLVSLFETLHQLVNLLIVLPDNLKQVCGGDLLVRHSSYT